MKNTNLFILLALIIPVICNGQKEINSNKVSTDSCYAYFEFTTDASNQTHFENLSVGTDSAGIISFYWSFCDGGISTTWEPTHIFFGDNICACLTIEDITGCTDTYCYPWSTGINNTETIFSLYPNPAQSQFNISIQDNLSRNVIVTITNYLGEIAEVKSINTQSGSSQTMYFDIKKYPTGIYYIYISDSSEIIYKTKLMKL